MIESSLTTKEYYRLHGTLPENEIRRLIELDENYSNVAKAVQEANEVYKEISTGYVYEGEFYDILKALRELKEVLKKPDQMAIDDIIYMVEEKERELTEQGNYCKEQFENFMKELKQGEEK